jgi:dipeptidyl aminopeptidase/acylaminoacyl peptidase
MWSPSRRKIAFVSDRDGNLEIYVMNADGSGQRRLTRDPGVDGSPTWSPDGRRIAIGSRRHGNFDIYVWNAERRSQLRLTRNPGLDADPTWSADGRRIAFESARGGNFGRARASRLGDQAGRCVRSPRQPLLSAAVGIHDVDLVVAIAVADEGDSLPVGRPRRIAVKRFVPSQPPLPGAVGVHDVHVS